MSWPWSELGLDGPAPLDEIRRAYARRVKEVHPEEDPEGFQQLHAAYQAARRAARQGDQRGHGDPPSQSARQIPKERQEEEKKETDPSLDFAALLQDGKQPEEKKEPESPLDFDTLLEQDEPLKNAGEPEETSWDFGRLFQEENARKSGQTGGEQEENLERALELVELLLDQGRSRLDWERFLMSQVFFQVKWDPRFMAGLAETFRMEPEIDQQIRMTVCTAYGFRDGRVPKEHQAFFRAVTGRTEQPRPRKKQRRRVRPVLLLLTLLAWLAVALVYFLPKIGRWADQRTAEELCQYIQEDFGYPVESRYTGYDYSLEEFYLPVQQLSFQAWPVGERDLAQGLLGYETTLGVELAARSLEEFSEEWAEVCQLNMLNGEGERTGAGQAPESFAFSTGLWDGADFLTALKGELDSLSQEAWYDLWSPQFQIRLEVWDTPYFTYDASDGSFPIEEILTCYEQELPTELISNMVEECGLGELDFAGKPYHLENLGMVTLEEDAEYFMMAGVDETTGRTERLYLYDTIYLISTPADSFRTDMGRLEYAKFLMSGEKIPGEWEGLPWPVFGIYRHGA